MSWLQVWLPRFHLFAMGVWGLLLGPTIHSWKESILWVAVMSVYAIIVGHFGAYDAARAERELKKEIQKLRSEIRTLTKIIQEE